MAIDDRSKDPSYPAYGGDGINDEPPGEDPVGAGGPADAIEDSFEEEVVEGPDTSRDAWMIEKAQAIYANSTDYLNANIVNQWEQSLHHFNNEHAPGSPMYAKKLKRSKLFRPKTRSTIKAQEAAMAVAAFSSKDLLIVEAENPSDKAQQVSAQITKNLMQYRLEKRMPWFLTFMGGWQDTKVYGVCISHQYWSFVEDTDLVPALDENGEQVMGEDDEGNPVPMGEERTKIRVDKLCCDLIAPENFRFSPMCDWRDPANTSPYITYMMPIYAGEALEMMEKVQPDTGMPTWRKYTLSEILATRREQDDRTRQAREGRDRIDPAQTEDSGDEFTVVWAHMNIIRVDGEDLYFWTMGTELPLTGIRKLRDDYPWLEEGERPFVVGFSTIEAHRNYPASDAEQMSGLQVEINTIANQRIDNVKLVLNKRYYVRRGAQVDLEALMRNTPGGGVMMNDTDKDVREVDTPDVTSSSYVEHDRLATELDELIGSFSTGTMSSSNAGKAVGTMSMAQQTAGSVQDYGIRVFMETWARPVMFQLMRLIQRYETDEVLLALAVENSDLWQRYGINKATDDILTQRLSLDVDVGIGNTDPMRRVERLIFGVSNVMGIPGLAERVKPMEVANEIFGSLGYKNAKRFFRDDQEQQAYVEETGPQIPPEIQAQMRELDLKEKESTERHERETMNIQLDFEAEMAKVAANNDLTLTQLYEKLGVERLRIQTQRDIEAMKNSAKTRELNLKSMTGSGI